MLMLTIRVNLPLAIPLLKVYNDSEVLGKTPYYIKKEIIS